MTCASVTLLASATRTDHDRSAIGVHVLCFVEVVGWDAAVAVELREGEDDKSLYSQRGQK